MQIRRVLGPAMASLLAVAVVLALAGPAAGLGEKGPQSYYLALGDSIAYGIQPGKGGQPTFDTGYVDPFAARLRKLSPKIKVVNYGCPGESSVTFTRGGCPGFAEDRSCTIRFAVHSSRQRCRSCGLTQDRSAR